MQRSEAALSVKKCLEDSAFLHHRKMLNNLNSLIYVHANKGFGSAVLFVANKGLLREGAALEPLTAEQAQ